MNRRFSSLFFILLIGIICQSCKIDKPKGAALPQKQYVYLTFDDGPLDGSQDIDSIILAEDKNQCVSDWFGSSWRPGNGDLL